MKYLSHSIKLDETFQPKLIVTLELNFEAVQDGPYLLGEDEFVKHLGLELLKILQNRLPEITKPKT